MRHPLHIWESALEDHAPRFMPGTPIFDATGAQLGVVSPYHMQGAELLMRTGRFWFATDSIVPLEAIAAVDAQGIRLRYTRAEVNRQAWAATPTTDALLAAQLPVSPMSPTADAEVEPPPAA